MALYVIILYMFHSKSSSIFLFIKLYSGVLLILIDLISSLTFFFVEFCILKLQSTFSINYLLFRLYIVGYVLLGK